MTVKQLSATKKISSFHPPQRTAIVFTPARRRYWWGSRGWW